MGQTRIDQFYKVTSSSKPEGVKGNIKKSSNISSPLIDKVKGRRMSNMSKISPRKNKQSPMNERQEVQNNVSLGNRTPSPRISRTPRTSLCKSKQSPMNERQEVYNVSIVSGTPSPKTPVSHGSRFTPKTSSLIKDTLDKSPQVKRQMARRKLFKDKTEELISATVDNLNLAKEGAIANNNFNLEKIYSSGRFSYNYKPIDPTVSTRYEINDVVVPTDRYSFHFFLVVVTVFSNPINCGYFDKDELDFIFSLITLRRHAQALLIRMLKRKHMWHRITHIKYDEISKDLGPVFDELVSRSIFTSNMEEQDMSVLLNLLQAPEIRKLCQESKITVKSKSGKKEGIDELLSLCRKTKSLFPGIATPATKLRAMVNRRLGRCIILSARLKELVDRIITLLIPNQDPTQTLSNLFQMLWEVDAGQIKFPQITISDLPIFASKGHLLDFIEAKNTLTNVLTAIEEKKWETVRNIGISAAQRLPLFLEVESESLENSSLPNYIRHFMPGYTWLKVLSKSIDAFKKDENTRPYAIEFLRILIDQNCHMKYRKGQWYAELIKIERHHEKNFEASVIILSDAVLYENLTEVDRLDMLDAANLIYKRKSGINKRTKDVVKDILDNMSSWTRFTFPNSTTIEGTVRVNTSQKKSVWCISKGEDEVYGSVESLALYHYKRESYIKGVHCEGAFPITLFATLFWDEIYNMNIPSAWVSLYQDAPLDLYSTEFYENRKEQIDMKLQIIRRFDSETLSKHLQREFELHCEYRSISQGNIFNDSNSFKEVAFCLGVEGVVGICERLIHNFVLWKAGFPDLIVWNPDTRRYKIVEVKGPGDTLSTKQKLWLNYLNQLGLNTEVCFVVIIFLCSI